jgi:hypothetical protein
MRGKRDSVDPKEKFTDVNYGDAQWDATRASDQSVFLPENLSEQDVKTSAALAQPKAGADGKPAGQGGICKLFGLSAMYGVMDPAVNAKWVENYGRDKDAAKAAWIEASVSQQKPVTVPPKLQGRFTAKDFPTDLASTFTRALTGSVGFADDYAKLTTIKQACDDLGLREKEYTGGGFILQLPGNKIDEAIQKTGRSPVEVIGKPSLYTSLYFAEFNYIAEDRIANTTAVNNKANTGAVDQKGKRELAVVQLPLAELLSSAPRFLP